MKLSVICPVYNEEKYIVGCIESILSQDFPPEEYEVIFADGMSTDRTRGIIAGYSALYPRIRLIDNPRRIVPPGLNAAIRASRGDIVMRLDAHASYRSDYFRVLVDAVGRYGADNVGAPCQTDVLRPTPKSLAIREVLAHPLGVGNSAFRTGVTEPRRVDTVPFGCWRRDVFDRYGLYDERLVRNQDIELNKRILRGGGKIVIVPDTCSTYYARETFRALARNNYANGLWNILTVWYTRQFSSLSLRHFVPLLFVLSLLLPLAAGLAWHPLWYLAAASAVAWLAVVSAISARLALRRRLNFFYLVASFAVLHLSYGWGSLCGLLRLPFVKR